jgi:hypothetical protein
MCKAKHKEIIKYCEDGNPCVLDAPSYSTNSLTHLGLLPGGPDTDSNAQDNEYGAQFKSVNYKTPYYQLFVHERVKVPWLAAKCESTFMNRIKEKNEPPVKSYKDLLLSPLPYDNYGRVVEDFVAEESAGTINPVSFIVFCVLCIVFFLYLSKYFNLGML